MAFAGASPAAAASASASINCTYVSVVTLRIHASASGTGSWQNRKACDVARFTFPGGASVVGTSWLSVNWAASTSGYFCSQPSVRCGS